MAQLYVLFQPYVDLIWTCSPILHHCDSSESYLCVTSLWSVLCARNQIRCWVFFIQISKFLFHHPINPHLCPICVCFSADLLNSSAFLQRTYNDYDQTRMVYLSVQGVLLCQTHQPGVVGHAGTTLGTEKVQTSWRKSSETQGLLF